VKVLDSTYINSGGGIELFDILKNRINFDHYLVDYRLKISESKNITISKNEKTRKDFLKKINGKYTYLSLNNVPPPIHTNVRTIIYFHNILILETFDSNLSIKEKLMFKLKYLYIKYKAKENYLWVVQTDLMRNKLSKAFNVNFKNISVFPFFEKTIVLNTNKNKNTFIYVASYLNHKNHNKLIDSFIHAAQNTKTEIELHLTINENELKVKTIPRNFKIYFHGNISKSDVNALYKITEFLIYPSLNESFGLPLIEAANHGCKVIASDLPYVHEIIKPSLTFDPYSVESISKSISKAIETNNLPETKVLVENKLDNFIDFIISQDVQQ